MSKAHFFAPIIETGKIWVIGAVRGNADGLSRMHDYIARHASPEDSIIYTGNILGYGDKVKETVQELLQFRCWFLSMPPFMPLQRFIILHGAQEEMWIKTLLLHRADKPKEVVDFIFARGGRQTLTSYGMNDSELKNIVATGTRKELESWTVKLRETILKYPGHSDWLFSCKWAAYQNNRRLLVVSSGLDTNKKFFEQSDELWWCQHQLNNMHGHYMGFLKIIAGHNPTYKGLHTTPYFMSLDGASGMGGKVIAACLTPDGIIKDQIYT